MTYVVNEYIVIYLLIMIITYFYSMWPIIQNPNARPSGEGLK